LYKKTPGSAGEFKKALAMEKKLLLNYSESGLASRKRKIKRRVTKWMTQKA
jgi:hypothetical protein